MNIYERMTELANEHAALAVGSGPEEAYEAVANDFFAGAMAVTNLLFTELKDSTYLDLIKADITAAVSTYMDALLTQYPSQTQGEA